MALKETIIRDLRNGIINGEIKPGEHITEHSICRRFGVSRTPAREILRQLEQEGLVKINPNSGARVPEFSIKDISDVYEVLIIFEGAAARFACSQITDEEIRKLKDCQFMMEKTSSQKNLDLVFELNIKFHTLITEFTKNPYFIGIRKNFEPLVNRFARLAKFIPTNLEKILKDHPKIIDAMTKRNAPLAEFLARDHMEDAKTHMLSYIQDLQKRDGEKKVLRHQPVHHKVRK